MVVNAREKLQESPIVKWNCTCRHGSFGISLTHHTCPFCNSAIPKTTRIQVYRQVYHEIHEQILQEESVRWGRFSGVSLKCRLWFRIVGILGIVAWAVLILLSQPTILQSLQEKLSGFDSMILRALPEKIRIGQWTALLEKIESIPVDAIMERLWIIVRTAFQAIWLTLSRILGLIKLIFSFIFSLFQ